MDVNSSDNDEIIGIRVGDKLYFGSQAIEYVKKHNDYDELISRARIQFMIDCDLTHPWDELIKYPTLFKLSEVLGRS